jgi:RecA-family ATPase
MNILETYQKYLNLKKIGKNYFALCPFHVETNPSFSINPHTGWFHCFGCNAKGNIFQFLLKMKEQGVEIDEEDKRLIQRKPETQKELQNKAKHNIELGKNYRKTCQKTYEQKKAELLQNGYSFVSEYIYYSLNGVEEYRVYRFERPKEDGEFEKQIFPVVGNMVGMQGKKQILYGLHQFMFANLESEIWLSEGEKCTDAVIAAMPSSANIVCLGFRKASDFKGYENLFQNKKVVVFQDNDKTGQTNTENLVEILKPFAKEIVVVKFSEFQEGYDVADYLEDFGWNQLIERISISEKITTAEQKIEIEIQEVKQFMAENLGMGVFAPEKWLCKNILYKNSICLLDAAGAAGKSFLALQLAVSYILQNFFLLPEFEWDPDRNRKILYVTATLENPMEIVNNRLLQICFLHNFNHFDRETLVENFEVAYLDAHALFEPDPETQMPEETEAFMKLAKYIEKNNIQLIIVDPISLFFLIDLNSNEKIPALYRKLQQTGATWILIHHQSKATMYEETENTSQRGASALRDNARLRITMKRRVILHMGTVAMDLYIEKANFSRYNQHHIFLTPKPPFSVISTTIWEHQEFMRKEDEVKKGKENKKKNGKYEEVIYKDAEFA